MIFKIIFQASGLLLFGSKKPGRTSYYISKAYSVRCEENENDFSIDLIETDLITLPSVHEILLRTKLRTDEKDKRIYSNIVPIKIPLNMNKQSCKPN